MLCSAACCMCTYTLLLHAQQLVELFTPESAYTTLLPLTFHLLADPVCVVREVHKHTTILTIATCASYVMKP
jgi:hypothetical protein